MNYIYVHLGCLDYIRFENKCHAQQLKRLSLFQLYPIVSHCGPYLPPPEMSAVHPSLLLWWT